jgi:hypothetical protein
MELQATVLDKIKSLIESVNIVPHDLLVCYFHWVNLHRDLLESSEYTTREVLLLSKSKDVFQVALQEHPKLRHHLKSLATPEQSSEISDLLRGFGSKCVFKGIAHQVNQSIYSSIGKCVMHADTWYLMSIEYCRDCSYVHICRTCYISDSKSFIIDIIWGTYQPCSSLKTFYMLMCTPYSLFSNGGLLCYYRFPANKLLSSSFQPLMTYSTASLIGVHHFPCGTGAISAVKRRLLA